MRTLQEKYNGIQEGKFSKENFLADARKELPNLVTRFNGYDDAVQILKNKGMIREVSAEESFKDYSNDALADMIINSSRFEGNEEGIARVKAELERRKQAVKEDYSRVLELPDGNYFAIDGDWEDEYQGNNGLFFTVKGNSVYDKNGQAIQSSPREFISQFTPEEILKVENVNEAKQTKLTKKSLTDYRYKPTNEMDKYPYEQILRGLRVELEGLGVNGTPTAEEYAKALSKVSKNLAKDSIFYTNQVAGVNPKVDQHDQMVTATAKNTVDTFNGMKKAELKEGFKKLIKKVLSESMGDMFGDEERAQRKANYGQPGEDEYDFYSDPENYKEEDDLFELQEAKEDSYYKSELADFLDDNGIFGYTDKIHNIMTGPDEAENVDELVRFLEDNQIYGYNRGIERIYADYPYDQHWMNQPDEEGDPGYKGYESPSDRMFNSDAWVQAQRDMMETKKSLSELLK